MLHKLLIPTLLLILSHNAYANKASSIEELPAGSYQLDKSHASVIWKVSHMGLSNYTARFTDFDAEIILSPKNIEESKLIANVNPTSVETDYPYPEKKDFDAEIAYGKDWFNSENHPTITFKSTKIKKVANDKGIITGDLTFLGVTKTIDLDVTFNGAYLEKPFSKQPAVGFSARGKIKRSDFGFKTYIPLIGDEVEILIETEFNYQNAE